MTAADDTAVPDVGANAATTLSDKPSVMAVVGTLNSTVAEKVAPILNGRKVVMISPANTDPALTRGTDPATKVRPFDDYFRERDAAVNTKTIAAFVLTVDGLKK